MSNESGINPQGWRVLILPLEIETKTESGIIVTTVENTEREQMANTTGQVVAMGEECNNWCKVGDRVVFAKFSGLVYLGKDNRKYRVINDQDIVATLDGDVKLVDPFLGKGVQA
jgi:co-chaperonin GroES (HSP10)